MPSTGTIRRPRGLQQPDGPSLTPGSVRAAPRVPPARRRYRGVLIQDKCSRHRSRARRFVLRGQRPSDTIEYRPVTLGPDGGRPARRAERPRSRRPGRRQRHCSTFAPASQVTADGRLPWSRRHVDERLQILHRPSDLRGGPVAADRRRRRARRSSACRSGEYPGVVPPTVVVRATYPGANPKVIAETVAAPLEQEINGVENMLYMFSQATSDGPLTLTITFAIGTDLDKAQVQVQNRVAQALPRLPAEVQRIGVTTEKASPDFMMVVHLRARRTSATTASISPTTPTCSVKDELARIDGVGAAQVFGAGDYSMRVWLDPDRLAVAPARRPPTSSRRFASRTCRWRPACSARRRRRPTRTFQLSVNARGRLTTEDEFGDIVVRATPHGQITRVRDVGRVELGASQYALRSLLDNKPAVAMGIFQRPGSNALQASDAGARHDGASDAGLPGGRRATASSTTRRCFVRESIRAVVETLFERHPAGGARGAWCSCRRGGPRSSRSSPCRSRSSARSRVMLGVRLLAEHAVALRPGARRSASWWTTRSSWSRTSSGTSSSGCRRSRRPRRAMDEVSGPIIAIALVLCRGVRADRVRQRPDRPVLPAVRADHRDLDGDLGVQLADAEPGAGVAAAASRVTRASAIVVQRAAWIACSAGSSGPSTASSAGRPARTRTGVARVLRAVVRRVERLCRPDRADRASASCDVPPGFVPTQDKDYLVAFAQLPDAALARSHRRRDPPDVATSR